MAKRETDLRQEASRPPPNTAQQLHDMERRLDDVTLRLRVLQDTLDRPGDRAPSRKWLPQSVRHLLIRKPTDRG